MKHLKKKIMMNDLWENPFYLCKKHAKKILKELGIEYKGEEE